MTARPRGSGPVWMIYTFPAVALLVGLIAVYFRVRDGASAGLWALPAAAAALTFLGMRRVFADKKLPSTIHQYSMSAPWVAERKLGQLIEKLGGFGYEPAAHVLDETGQVGAPASPELELVGTQFRIVDRRAHAELGMVAIRLRQADGGAIAGLIEATDTGPGLYDEMAQYLILALGDLLPHLEFTTLSRAPAWRKPAALREELPGQPNGLALL